MNQVRHDTIGRAYPDVKMGARVPRIPLARKKWTAYTGKLGQKSKKGSEIRK
jgi:hypothetical protein